MVAQLGVAEPLLEQRRRLGLALGLGPNPEIGNVLRLGAGGGVATGGIAGPDGRRRAILRGVDPGLHAGGQGAAQFVVLKLLTLRRGGGGLGRELRLIFRLLVALDQVHAESPDAEQAWDVLGAQEARSPAAGRARERGVTARASAGPGRPQRARLPAGQRAQVRGGACGGSEHAGLTTGG